MREARAHASNAQSTACGGEPAAISHFTLREERVQETGHVGVTSTGGVHLFDRESGDVVVSSVVHVRTTAAQGDDGYAGPELNRDLRTLHYVSDTRGQLKLVLTELDHVEPSRECIVIEGL